MASIFLLSEYPTHNPEGHLLPLSANPLPAEVLDQALQQLALAEAHLQKGLAWGDVATVRAALAQGASWTRSVQEMQAALATVLRSQNTPLLTTLLDTLSPHALARLAEVSGVGHPLVMAAKANAAWAIAPLMAVFCECGASAFALPRPSRASAPSERPSVPTSSPVIEALFIALDDGGDALVDALLESAGATIQAEMIARLDQESRLQPLFMARTAHAFERLWALVGHRPDALVAQVEGKGSIDVHKWVITRGDWLRYTSHDARPKRADTHALVQTLSTWGQGWTPDHLALACGAALEDTEGAFIEALDAVGVDWYAPLPQAHAKDPEDPATRHAFATLQAEGTSGWRRRLAEHWGAVLAARHAAQTLSEAMGDPSLEGEPARPRQRPRL